MKTHTIKKNNSKKNNQQGKSVSFHPDTKQKKQNRANFIDFSKMSDEVTAENLGTDVFDDEVDSDDEIAQEPDLMDKSLLSLLGAIRSGKKEFKAGDVDEELVEKFVFGEKEKVELKEKFRREGLSDEEKFLKSYLLQSGILSDDQDVELIEDFDPKAAYVEIQQDSKPRHERKKPSNEDEVNLKEIPDELVPGIIEEQKELMKKIKEIVKKIKKVNTLENSILAKLDISKESFPEDVQEDDCLEEIFHPEFDPSKLTNEEKDLRKQLFKIMNEFYLVPEAALKETEKYKYNEVPPENFGLTVDQILNYSDSKLDKIAPLSRDKQSQKKVSKTTPHKKTKKRKRESSVKKSKRTKISK